MSNHPGGENTGDNLQETHGQSLPSHSILISADLCGSVFHRSNYSCGGGDGPGTVGVDDEDGLLSRLVGVGETPTPRPRDVIGK